MSRDDDEAPPWVAHFRVQKETVRSLNADPELSLILLAILVFLATSKEGATPTVLGQEYDLDMAQISKYLRTLREGGYVHPVADENDARSKRYYNTLKGSEAAAAHLRRSGYKVEGKDLPHADVKPMKIKGS